MTTKLLATYTYYLEKHIQSPLSWSRPEIYQNCREVIKQQMNPVYADRYMPFPTSRNTRWYEPQIRAFRKMFGESLSTAFKEEDSGKALEIINNGASRTRFIRECAKTDFANLISEKCNDSNIHVCNDCNYIDHENEGSYAYDDYWVCSSCIDDNYSYSDNRGTYVSNDDYEDEQEEEYDEDADDDEEEELTTKTEKGWATFLLE